MSTMIPVLKDENGQRPIPSIWRGTFVEIIKAFSRNDFSLCCGVAGVRPISPVLAASIASNLKRYGAQLTALPEESWLTSVCQWMGEYWDVLIDLFTVEEGASDLAMAVRVFEKNGAYEFEIHSVYVP